MIKNLFEDITERIKLKKEARIQKREYQEKMSKEYPSSCVYWGEYDKDVEDGDLSYTYTHSECFLASTKEITNDTKFIRLTGDNAGNEISVKEIDVTTPNIFEDAIVVDNGIEYTIFMSDCNTIYQEWVDNKNITLGEIIKLADDQNTFARKVAKSSIMDSKIEEEFTNN